MSKLISFLAELQRRRVYRIAVIYGAAAIAAAEAADLFLPRLGLPDWTVTLVVIFAVAGFPLALLLAWAFDITPAGVRRTGPAPETTPVAAPARWRLLGSAAAGLVILVGGGWWLSTVTLRPSAAIDRLAVLPLTSLMNDTEQQYFVEGMHDALITELAQAGVAVIARTSVVQYEGTRKSVREIARELNVAAVIEGSVYRVGDSVRIQVQLIDGATEQHLWARTYDAELKDVLALHRRVTRAVASEIRLGLTPGARKRLTHKRSVDPEAYEAYLRGLIYLERSTPATRNTALHYFNTALEKDPTFAPAHLGIYQVWAGLRQAGIVPAAEATPKMRAALTKAFELDDGLPEVHHANATNATWTDWNWTAAESSFRRAIELNPNSARTRAFHSHYLHIMRRADEAIVEIQLALALDPFNPMIQALAGGSFLMARRFDEALAHYHTALELAPGSLHGLIGVSNVLHDAERYEEALTAELEMVRAGRGDPELAEAMMRGFAGGDYRAAMHRGAELLAHRSLTVDVAPERISRLYLRAGEAESALDWLERSYDKRDPNLPYINSGRKDFELLRGQPRFRTLLKKMNFL